MQLQVINADSDAERRPHLNLLQNETDLQLEIVQVKKIRSVDNSAILSEDVKNMEVAEYVEDVVYTNDTEHMKMYNQVIAFFSVFANVYGLELSFKWEWKKHVLFWCSAISLLISYICMAYTEYGHFVNRNYVRLLEPLVISGIAFSVNQILSIET